MTSNSGKIIQDVRDQFEHLLDFVSGEKAQSASAYQIFRFSVSYSLNARTFTKKG